MYECVISIISLCLKNHAIFILPGKPAVLVGKMWIEVWSISNISLIVTMLFRENCFYDGSHSGASRRTICVLDDIHGVHSQSPTNLKFTTRTWPQLNWDIFCQEGYESFIAFSFQSKPATRILTWALVLTPHTICAAGFLCGHAGWVAQRGSTYWISYNHHPAWWS